MKQRFGEMILECAVSLILLVVVSVSMTMAVRTIAKGRNTNNLLATEQLKLQNAAEKILTAEEGQLLNKIEDIVSEGKLDITSTTIDEPIGAGVRVRLTSKRFPSISLFVWRFSKQDMAVTERRNEGE